MSFDEASIVPLRAVVSEVIDNRGKTPPTQNRGNALIEINAINAERKYPNYEMVKKYVSDEIYQTWFRKGHPQKNDVLIPTVGTIGSVAFVNESHGCIAQNIIALRINESKCLGEFLYYYLKLNSSRMAMLGLDIGSVQPSIKVPHLMNMAIRIPSIKKQRAIAATLSSLDDKIELNNRINKTLEEMAQAMFKRWFVDFEFPDENGQPYKSSGGEMEESELGLIPKGWKVESLDSIADYLNGLAMQKYRPEGEEFVPVIKIRELNQGKSDLQSDKASPNIDSKYIVNDGDVLFSWSGSLDVKIWCGGKGGLNQHLFKVTSDRYEKWFYYLWTKHHLEKFRGIAQDKATTMGHIQRKHLQESFVVVPAQEALERMDSVMRPIFDIFITREIEAATLVAIRDTILPKLISGEIRVNESFAEDIGNGES